MARLLAPLAASLLLATAGCSTTDAGAVGCNPECGSGFQCDTQSGTCVPAGAGDMAGGAGEEDLPMADCTPMCNGLTPYCVNRRCVACTTDDNCMAGNVCKLNTCVPGCTDDARCKGGNAASTQICCSGQCFDGAVDPSHCGMCATSCVSGHAAAGCQNGQCTFGSCNPGFGDCNKDATDGCETNLHIDPNNCTGCGMACNVPNGTAGCSDGCYLRACNFGFDDCDGDLTNGCEHKVIDDPKNCGSCGTMCGAPAHAQAACVNGACTITSCVQGFTDCNNMPGDGCEVATGTDAKNCGACGVVCGGNLVCVNGGCTCPQCNIPNAKSKCVNNQCQFDSCLPGFFDCNNNTGDGCEIDLNNDAKNCSACGQQCPQNAPFCSGGMCGQGVDYGPAHSFTGLTSTHYITQGGCSTCGSQTLDCDATYFCTHFYSQPLGKNCAPVKGYVAGRTPNCGDAKMHKMGGCTGNGNNIPNTTCEGGPCKIGNWMECTSGITQLVCHCN